MFRLSSSGNYLKVSQVTGVLYHETTHVWQWNGQRHANGGLIEGIADYARLKAGYAPGHWVKPGQGDRWDQGYDITARFLDYCDSLKPGFVALLNANMKDGYTDDFFAQILGNTVQQLWQDYKANYAYQFSAGNWNEWPTKIYDPASHWAQTNRPVSLHSLRFSLFV